MTDNKERETVERDAYSAWVRERYMHPEHVFRDNYAWEAWQARAALAASQEKAEPFAACLSDAVNGGLSVMRIAPSDAVAVPVAAQASEPVAKRVADAVLNHCYGAAHVDDGMVRGVMRVVAGVLGAVPQPSAEAVRDAARMEAFEEAANTATGFLVGDPLAGIPLRNPMTHEIAAAIRALKSAPPQPAEQADECGDVVVTWDEDRTRILAVTRQDEDGRVLKIIALVPPGPPAEQPDEYMCPNCVTPWKCNGPHILPAEQPSAAPAMLTDEELASATYLNTVSSPGYMHSRELSPISAWVQRQIARAQGEKP